MWTIYVIGFFLTVAQSLQRPSREALLPRVDGLVVATGLYAALRSYPPTDASTPPSIAAIVSGIRYAVSRKDLLGTYVIDMVAMFMAMPIVLFPAFAETVLEEPRLVWLSPNVWWALGFLVLAGAADMISGIFRSTIWNQTIPDELRGRLAGIEMLSYSVGPMGGSARAGLVADLTSVRASMVSGGVLCVAGVAATSAALRDFWRYDNRTDEHAVRERALRAARSSSE